MSNAVVRWQMISPDPARTVAFYETMFGWSTSQANALGYREITAGDGGIDGGVWPAPPNAAGFVQLYISVDDVPAAVVQAESLGASVIVPASQLPDGDSMAVLRDPTGAPFVVCTLRR